MALKVRCLALCLAHQTQILSPMTRLTARSSCLPRTEVANGDDAPPPMPAGPGWPPQALIRAVPRRCEDREKSLKCADPSFNIVFNTFSFLHALSKHQDIQ